MRSVLSACAAVAIASGAVAQNDGAVPFVACVETTGESFTGQSRGTDAGRLTAQSSLGFSCVGVWQRLDDGTGAANFTCSDGRVGEALYDWFDPASGTAVGEGQFTNGDVVRFWSGTRLSEYFAQIDTSEEARMACSAERLLGS